MPPGSSVVPCNEAPPGARKLNQNVGSGSRALCSRERGGPLHLSNGCTRYTDVASTRTGPLGGSRPFAAGPYISSLGYCSSTPVPLVRRRSGGEGWVWGVARLPMTWPRLAAEVSNWSVKARHGRRKGRRRAQRGAKGQSRPYLPMEFRIRRFLHLAESCFASHQTPRPSQGGTRMVSPMPWCSCLVSVAASACSGAGRGENDARGSRGSLSPEHTPPILKPRTAM